MLISAIRPLRIGQYALVPADGLEALLGKRLLVGISYVKANGEVDEEVQFVGTVTSVDPLVAIDRGDGRTFTLPPDPDAFERAAPGEYRLRSTGEVVIDPDFVSTWT